MHLSVAIGLGLVFFVFQCWVTLRAHRAHGEIRALWTKWASSPSHFNRRSRDELLRQLDHLILSDKWRLMLRRLSVMAPLFGLLLTALGFIFLNPGSILASVGSDAKIEATNVFQALQPLYSGVLVGTSLAIINQILLQGIEQAGIEVRESCDVIAVQSSANAVSDAIADLGDVIRGITAAAQARLASAISDSEGQIRQFATSASNASETLAAITVEYNSHKGSLTAASTGFGSVVEAISRQMDAGATALRGEIQDLNSKLASTTVALCRSADVLDTASNTIASSVASFNSSIASLSSEVTSVIAAGARFQQSSIDAIAHAQQFGVELKELLNTELEQALRLLTAAAVQCQQGTQAAAQAGVKLEGSAGVIADGSRKLKSALDSLALELPLVEKQMESLAAAVTSQELALRDAPERLVEVMMGIRDQMAMFAKERSDATGQLIIDAVKPSVSRAVDQFRAVADNCLQATAALGNVTNSLKKSVDAANSGAAGLVGESNRLSAQNESLAATLTKIAISQSNQEGALAELANWSAAMARSLPAVENRLREMVELASRQEATMTRLIKEATQTRKQPIGTPEAAPKAPDYDGGKPPQRRWPFGWFQRK